MKHLPLCLLYLIMVTAASAQTYKQVAAWGGQGGGGGLFHNPIGIAVSRTGNIYVTDLSNYRVQKFASNGEFLTMWRAHSYPQNVPIAVAVDSTEKVYVTYMDGSIEVFTASGSFIKALSVTGYGICADRKGSIFVVGDTVSKIGSLGYPIAALGCSGHSIAVDDSGFVYVVVGDQDSTRIRRYGTEGTLVNNWAQQPVSAHPFQAGIIVDSAKYIYLTSMDRHKIFKYSLTGEVLGEIGGPGSALGFLNKPNGLALTQNGDLLVVDRLNSRLQFFTKDGTFLKAFGSFGGSGDGHFTKPYGLVVDATNGSVYVGDYRDRKIQKFSESGQFISQWSTASLTGNNEPEGISIDPQGKISVVGYGSTHVLQYSAEAMLLRDHGPFQSPSSIAVDARGALYIIDGSNRLQILDTTGRVTVQLDLSSRLVGPRGIGVSTSGSIYIADRGSAGDTTRLQQFSPVGTFMQKWMLGASASSVSPSLVGIAFDKDDNVYCHDDRSGLVTKIRADGSIGESWTVWGTGIGIGKRGQIYVVSGDSVLIYEAAVTSVESQHQPGGFALEDCFPNPFNPSTTIRFSIPLKSLVSLKIFDVLGREVETLLEGELQAGIHLVKWSAPSVPSGTYFYRLQAGEFVQTRKMLLLK